MLYLAQIVSQLKSVYIYIYLNNVENIVNIYLINHVNNQRENEDTRTYVWLSETLHMNNYIKKNYMSNIELKNYLILKTKNVKN